MKLLPTSVCLAFLCHFLFPLKAEIHWPWESRWWKGNLHTHTLWSDGDDYPDMVMDWYKSRGYHFLAISDHNIMLEGEKWVPVTTNKNSHAAFEKYRARFGEAVNVREENGNKSVRLKNLEELKPVFEERGRFLLIPSEEISANYEKLPIHVNATNLRELILPRGGNSVYEVMQNNIDAVLEQRDRTGQPMFPHLNHPNFHYAVTAEDLMRVRGERFFEVYNGHPTVNNRGDGSHPGTELMWDTILAWRLGILHMEPIYGIAVDDSHHYHDFKPSNSNSGRGWIHVRAAKLTPDAIVHAMEAGEFYASTGVELRKVNRGGRKLSVTIVPEPGTSYTIQFIGTLESGIKIQPDGSTIVDPHQIGRILDEQQGTSASYKLKGNEMYVRAKITSTKLMTNSPIPMESQQAWIQPLIPKKYLHDLSPRKTAGPYAAKK